MNTLELLAIAVGLSMDAFAVSVCKGMSVDKLKKRQVIITGAYFGVFQAIMPLIGYITGKKFHSYIETFDHWIAFILLVGIGAHMLKESRDNTDKMNDSFTAKTMLPLAIASSIDALIIGVSFAFLRVNILPAVSFIGCITFILSVIGIKLGKLIGVKFKSKAEILGGAILIIMGFKILFQHIGIIV